MEKIIKTHMLRHINENNIIRNDQFGFMKGRSTTTMLLKLLDDWTMALDDGIPTDVIFIDYSKAFDSIVHEKLLFKLKHYGFGATLIGWLKSFITNRKQFVSVNEATSNMSRVLSGVPQGSVLGPLLFILFLNDLSVDTADLNKFADDSELHSMVVDDLTHHNLCCALNTFVDWSCKWQLPIAAQKSNVLHIHNGNSNLNYDYMFPPR